MLHLAVVQTRHFQDIINQGQQLLACGADFADIFLHLSAVILMQICQLRHADNAVERRTHIVRQCGEEHISGLGIFACHLQRLLRQLQMLQLLLLFSLHLTEEENRFVLIQQIITHQAHIKPSVFLAEAIAELTAEVIDVTLYKLLDMLTGKAGRKLFGSLRLYILYHLLQQLIIISLRLLRSRTGAFQHIIASGNIIHPEHRQEGLAHNTDNLIDALQLSVQHVLTQRQTGSQQQENCQRQAEPMHQFLIITQQEVVGNSYDRYPALFRNLVINAAFIAIVVGDIRYITA